MIRAQHLQRWYILMRLANCPMYSMMRAMLLVQASSSLSLMRGALVVWCPHPHRLQNAAALIELFDLTCGEALARTTRLFCL